MSLYALIFDPVLISLLALFVALLALYRTFSE